MPAKLCCRTKPIERYGMEIGKTYDIAFAAGRYEIEYEKCVTCIKKTPKSYRVIRVDGTTRLVGQDSILELIEVSHLSGMELNGSASN